MKSSEFFTNVFSRGAAVGDILFRHGNREANRTCAFDLKEAACAAVHVPRQLGATQVFLECFNEAGNKLVRRLPCQWRSLYQDMDVYDADLSVMHTGLYFARVLLMTPFGKMTGIWQDRSLVFSSDANAAPSIQLSFSDFAFDAPKDMYGGIIYHIFVDRFSKGGDVPQKENTIINPDWDTGIPQFAPYNGAPLKNNMFFGGTLWGIRDKLPYLASLGVTTLYLSPIFDSPSNHKYDTADYMKVDPMFGGEEALRALIQAAAEHRIGIILDGVFNHTGADSIYFNKFGKYDSIGACQSTDSPYYPWYDFQSYPHAYTSWWGIDILPRIHPDVPACGDYFIRQNGVIRHYARMGIRGFRLDVADELSDTFLSKIKNALTEEAPGSVLYGEVWEDASNKIAYGMRKKYFLGKELDGVMNYPVREGLIAYFTSADTGPLSYALREVTEHAPERILHAQMNLLGTHDTVRILTALGGKEAGNRSNAELSVACMTARERACGIARLKMAYTVLATLPGVPSIYYGDEAGLEGYSDPFNRRPFPWGREDEDLCRYYKKIGRIRRKNPVYKTGAFRLLSLNEDALIFARFTDSEAYVTVINRTKQKQAYAFSSAAVNLISHRRADCLYVKPQSAAIFKMARGATMRALPSSDLT